MPDAQGQGHRDDDIRKVDIRIEGCSSKGPAWRISAIAGDILERYANDVRSFDMVRSSEDHLDVYFNDELVVSTKNRIGLQDTLDSKEIEALIIEWKAQAAGP